MPTAWPVPLPAILLPLLLGMPAARTVPAVAAGTGVSGRGPQVLPVRPKFFAATRALVAPSGIAPTTVSGMRTVIVGVMPGTVSGVRGVSVRST